MTEEDFYKEKIFLKVSLKTLIMKYPNLKESIKNWYNSTRYKKIQGFKYFLLNKLKQISGKGENIAFTNEQIYSLFQWWESTPKKCYYCSLPEDLLMDLRNLPGHINKRYPQRGKSLEIDRKQSNLPYSQIDNLVLACYWCNNAKTDAFLENEFQEIGKTIKTIWEKRLNTKL